jgi:hypothetical protein
MRQHDSFARSAPNRIVIPAKAGIHRQYEAWIPAFAGMTTREEVGYGEP